MHIKDAWKESESESRLIMSNSLRPQGLHTQSMEFSRQEY